MTRYLGIDYGSAMLKAAVTTSIDGLPSLLNAADDEVFMPSAVEWQKGNESFSAGVAAYHRRERADCNVAFGFRDRAIQPARIMIAGNEFDCVSAQAALLQALADSTGAATSASVISVPDAWSAGVWSLPMALERAQWHPIALVRESIAVVSMLDRPPGDELLLLSLGASAASATLLALRDDVWQIVANFVADDISGIALRHRLENLFAEEVIRSSRRDPREDSHADQILCDGVESLCRTLAARPVATIDCKFGYATFTRSYTLSELAIAAESFRAPLNRLVRSALEALPGNRRSCPVVAWGDLSLLLPLGEWLEPILAPKSPPMILSLDVVAAGAARISALLGDADSQWPDAWYATARVDNGEVRPERTKTTKGVAALHILQRLPDLRTRLAWAKFPCLRLLIAGDDTSKRVTRFPFTIGRSPRCDWVFASDAYPSVSGEHAAIERDGDRFLVKDLGSSNGTYVNQILVEKPKVLSAGDIIALGAKGPRFRFEQSTSS